MTFLDQLQEAQRLFGFCPCCGAPFRLSDVQVYAQTQPPRTPFDDLDDEQERLDLAEQRFEDGQVRLRAKAREAGQMAARTRLKQLLPFFSRTRLAPQDVKVLFHPVEYVAFRGLTDKQCTRVEFIDCPTTSSQRGRVLDSIATAIDKRRLEWITYRVSQDGTIETGAQ